MAKDHIMVIASVDWRMCIDDKNIFHPLHYVLYGLYFLGLIHIIFFCVIFFVMSVFDLFKAW